MAERIVRTQKDGNLAWLDLEMTGLDAQNDVILQAALIITTAELVPLEEFVCDIWQPDEALARMTPFVRDMHETTGLTARVRASKLDLGAAERKLMERVTVGAALARFCAAIASAKTSASWTVGCPG